MFKVTFKFDLIKIIMKEYEFGIYEFFIIFIFFIKIFIYIMHI